MSFVLFILTVLFHIQNNSVHSIFHKKYLQPSEEIDEKAEKSFGYDYYSMGANLTFES